MTKSKNAASRILARHARSSEKGPGISGSGDSGRGTPHALTIRGALLEDAEALGDLMTQLGYPTETAKMRARLESILTRPDYYAAVAELDGVPVGLVGAHWGLFFERDGRYGRVTALIVDEEHRGCGIGSALLRDAERWLSSQGALWSIINSGDHRAAAQRFYTKSGYESTGRRFTRPLFPEADPSARIAGTALRPAPGD